LADPIFFRVSELTDRPAAIAKAKKAITDIHILIETWESTMPQITSEEKDKLNQMVQKITEWIEEKLEAQNKVRHLHFIAIYIL